MNKENLLCEIEKEQAEETKPNSLKIQGKVVIGSKTAISVKKIDRSEIVLQNHQERKGR